MSQTVYEIPFSSGPQVIKATLGGTEYQLNLWWNNFSSSWMIDISDVNGNAIVSSIPMVTGRDLLEPYGHLEFGGQLLVQTNGKLDVPQFDDLGNGAGLFFVVND
jgi:hypothetical protein